MAQRFYDVNKTEIFGEIGVLKRNLNYATQQLNRGETKKMKPCLLKLSKQ